MVDATGSLRYAMHEVKIQKFSGKLVKDYQQDGVYIMDVDIQQGLLELKQAQWNVDRYTEIPSEHIMNNVKNAEDEVISIATATTVPAGKYHKTDLLRGQQEQESPQDGDKAHGE